MLHVYIDLAWYHRCLIILDLWYIVPTTGPITCNNIFVDKYELYLG